jgi:hypothetical protein
MFLPAAPNKRRGNQTEKAFYFTSKSACALRFGLIFVFGLWFGVCLVVVVVVGAVLILVVVGCGMEDHLLG